MNNSIRVKCRVTDVHNATSGRNGRTVVLKPEHDNTIPENQRFTRSAAPVGHVELQIENDTVLDAFAPGRECYLELTPIGSAQPDTAAV